jgi:hypothetical protein
LPTVSGYGKVIKISSFWPDDFEKAIIMEHESYVELHRVQSPIRAIEVQRESWWGRSPTFCGHSPLGLLWLWSWHYISRSFE